jgi:hypothetical protein
MIAVYVASLGLFLISWYYMDKFVLQEYKTYLYKFP